MEFERHPKISCAMPDSESKVILDVEGGETKWVKLGSENTKFFHTKATINYRHNHISTLQNEDQVDICDHDGKAIILWKLSNIEW
jgi:hypothetical protein